MLSFFTGLPAKILGGMALAAVIIGLLMSALHQHDAGIRAQMQAAQNTAIAAAHTEVAIATQAALEKAVADAKAQATADAALKAQINAEPKTSACMSSPSVRDLLNSVRQRHTNSAGAGH